jgi:hypothetical protein
MNDLLEFHFKCFCCGITISFICNMAVQLSIIAAESAAFVDLRWPWENCRKEWV